MQEYLLLLHRGPAGQRPAIAFIFGGDVAVVVVVVQILQDLLYTLALPLSEYREKLLSDNTFLRYICRTLTEKLSDATSPARRLPLREQLMRYIQAAGVGGELRDLTHLSRLMHVSTRQLARILQAMCSEGILERSKKGVYLIRNANSMER